MKQLSVSRSVHWCFNVWRRGDDHVVRLTFDFEGEHQRKSRKRKRIWKKQVEEEWEARKDMEEAG